MFDMINIITDHYLFVNIFFCIFYYIRFLWLRFQFFYIKICNLFKINDDKRAKLV